MSTLASPLPMRHSASVLARLNGPWHRPALWTFAGIVLAHWAEHVVQAWQIWGMGMPRHHALGVLGMAWPWLVHSEWLHYGYAVIMLAGLLLLRPGMAGRARTWWGVAIAIQFWHHAEHALLLGQALTGWRLGGGPQPSSILQLLVPRVELHLFYNAVVFVPMVIGMAYHLLPSSAEAAKADCTCARRLRSAAAGLAGFALLSVAGPLRGQAVDDAVMMPNHALGTGIVLAHESWDRYWEGSLKRGNENIGRVSTRTDTWVAAYGVTGQLTLLAALPYVETRASRGTLKEMHGVQDVSMAAKYRVASGPAAGRGRVSAIVAGAVGIPVGDYSPDFLPLSIGLGSRRVSGRFTVERWAASRSCVPEFPGGMCRGH